MIAEKLTKLANDIALIISKSNETTKKTDVTLNAAVDNLILGYGSNGSLFARYGEAESYKQNGISKDAKIGVPEVIKMGE